MRMTPSQTQWRERFRTILICAAALVCAVLLVHRYRAMGAPYFRVADTVHGRATASDGTRVIAIAARIRETLPRKATITALRPSQGPKYAGEIYFTMVGVLPHQEVTNPVHIHEGSLPRFVVAIEEPFEHESYRLVASFPEGRLYEKKP
jgi:hypothetical protein